MLTDIAGWYRRNVKKMKAWQIKKDLREINQVRIILENKLKELGEVV